MPSSPHLPRVLHVVISLQPGGLEKLVAEWTTQRNRLAPGRTAVCCLDSSDTTDVLPGNVPVVTLDAERGRFPWDRRAVRRLREFCLGTGVLREERRSRRAPGEERLTTRTPNEPFDVIHSHNLAAWQYAALAIRSGEAFHVHTEHGSMRKKPGRLKSLRIRWLERRTDWIVSVSESAAAELKRFRALQRSRLTVIANGIDPGEPAADSRAALRRRYRRELNIPDEARVLGSVGRLASIKGYDRLIQAFQGIRHLSERTVPTSGGPVYLLLVGDGPERAALQELAAASGVQDRIVFAGHRGDARDMLSAMDVFVLPSRSEGLSLALLEAMAAVVPVMVTDTGDSRNVIADGAAGVVLPGSTADWPVMIAAQLAALDTPETRRRLNIAADRLRRQYTLDAMADAYEKIYSQATARRYGPPTC